MTLVRIAIAGAGAVVETFHLPAARLCPEIRVVALADKNLDRARAVAGRFGIRKVTADYRELQDGADAVLIALPNVLHAPAAIHFLRQGMPVLVEKPMALGVAEAEEMIQAARAGNAILAVGLVGRQASGARWIKRAVAEGQLGPLKSLALEYGALFSWQPASSFLFSKEQAGGGVLIDLGTHMMDLTIWWAGKPTVLEYRDDAMGGLEAECRAILSFAGSMAPLEGVVSLSRLRTLMNRVRLVGERRAADWDIATDTVRVWSSAGQPEAVLPGFPQPPRRPLREMFAEQLRAFARAAAGLGEPTASGETALAVVDLIERCYSERRQMELPWMKPVLSV
jgi:predicted dehydrogenase